MSDFEWILAFVVGTVWYSIFMFVFNRTMRLQDADSQHRIYHQDAANLDKDPRWGERLPTCSLNNCHCHCTCCISTKAKHDKWNARRAAEISTKYNANRYGTFLDNGI